MIHYLVVESYFRKDSDGEIWMVLGTLVQIGKSRPYLPSSSLSGRVPEDVSIAIRMGYHRDASHFAKLSAFDGEMRRRPLSKNNAEIEKRFSKDVKRKFKYELWALPQKKGVRKIFRYKKDKLTQFMPRDATKAKKDQGIRLYFERRVNLNLCQDSHLHNFSVRSSPNFPETVQFPSNMLIR